MLIFPACSIEQVVLSDTARESPGRDNRNHPPFIVVEQHTQKLFFFFNNYQNMYKNCLSKSENIAKPQSKKCQKAQANIHPCLPLT